MANPAKITQPIANEGDKNTIPNTTTETDIASQALGFPKRTGLPITNNGVPPQREDFNGLFYLLSSHNFFAQSGNLYEYDATLEYAVNAIVVDAGTIYICKQANGVANPHKPSTETTATYWETLKDFVGTANFRGTFETWTAVPTDPEQYLADYTGSKTPTNNDYIIVKDASAFGATYTGTWRFNYVGVWADKSKNGWNAAYEIKSGGAINDTITSTATTWSSNKINTELGYKEATANKVTAISATSTDTQYPSAKCVYDLIGNLETLINTL